MISIHPAMARVTRQEKARLSLFGLSLLLGSLGFYVLMQSITLWERPVILPGSPDGFPASISTLFRWDWIHADRFSSLALLNVGIYIAVLAVLFAAYWMALRRAFGLGRLEHPEMRRTLWIILGVAGVVLFLFLWVPGSTSSDLYSYIWYGRIIGVYGDNPFIHAPIEYATRGFESSWWIHFVYWKDVTSVYGPVWLGFAGAIAWIAQALGGDISLHLMGHRLLAGIAHIANILLVWQIARLFVERYRPPFIAFDSAQEPEAKDPSAQRWRITPQAFRIAATLTYAWCPLALIEFGANGHNDVLMLTGVLAGVWLHLSGRWRLAVLALALASLVKVIALFWLFSYVWVLLWQPTASGQQSAWRNRAGIVTQAGLITLGAWAVCYAPFWAGPETFKPLLGGPPASLFVNSLASLARWKGGEWLHSLAIAEGWRGIASMDVEAVRTLLEPPLRWLSLAIAIPFMAVWLWRARTLPQMASAWGWAMFVYLTVGAVWLWPWYVAWLLPAIVLVGPGRLFKAVQILCATSLVLYGIFPVTAPPLDAVTDYRSLITVAPALCYAIGSWGISRWRGRAQGRAAVSGGRVVTEAG